MTSTACWATRISDGIGLAVELQLDLDPLISTPAWRGLKLMELLARHSLYLIGREVGRYIVGAQ